MSERAEKIFARSAIIHLDIADSASDRLDRMAFEIMHYWMMCRFYELAEKALNREGKG